MAGIVARQRREREGDRRRDVRRVFRAPVPPLDLLWSYRRRPATDLNILKATRAAIVWRCVEGRDVASIVFRYLRWLRLPKLVIAALVKEGAGTRGLFGRSLSGQFSDMIRVAIANGLSPKDYYFAGLARYGGSQEMFRYVPPRLMGALMLNLSRGSIKDKAAFESRCRDAGLRVVRTVAIAPDVAVRTPVGEIFAGCLPDRDLILKPVRGGGGRGIEGWRSIGEGRFRGSDGAILSSDGLAARALSLANALGLAMLIQENVANHQALRPFAGDALATTRIVTLINESGEPEIVDSFFRTSIHADAAVDNFHAGGMLFPIDIATGAFLPGMTDKAYDAKAVTHHPQTGGLVAGRVHPGWQAVAELSLRLHRLFPEMVMPGWDIGFDADGPIAVEGNDTPRFSLNRQSTFGGLVGTRTLTLLALHAEQWLAANEPEGSRWRVPKRPAQAASATRRSPSSSAFSP
jgi:hypothetical protein